MELLLLGMLKEATLESRFGETNGLPVILREPNSPVITSEMVWAILESEDENYFEESHNDIESQFSVDDIQFLIDNLPDGYRMVFNLYCIEGFKHHEIATMLGINEGTSKSQLARARYLLQKMITDSVDVTRQLQNG